MKMKAKGFGIALIRLLGVCYLTYKIFLFVYKARGLKFGRMVIFLFLCIVKRKGYHIVMTQDIRLLFTRVYVRRSVSVRRSVRVSVNVISGRVYVRRDIRKGIRKGKRKRDIRKRVIKCWNKEGALTRQCQGSRRIGILKSLIPVTRDKGTSLF